MPQLHIAFTATCDAQPDSPRFYSRGHVINSRTSAAFAVLVLFCTSGLASPAPTTSWTPLATRAHAIDIAAQRGDWMSAQRSSNDLVAQWAAKRPTAIQHGLKGKAYAESFDASLKWISSAVTQRDARNVHQAAGYVERTVHELEERAPDA